eukprot:scaffold98629_cov74-Phaeocystis_antarctica.AAC.2
MADVPQRRRLAARQGGRHAAAGGARHFSGRARRAGPPGARAAAQRRGELALLTGPLARGHGRLPDWAVAAAKRPRRVSAAHRVYSKGARGCGRQPSRPCGARAAAQARAAERRRAPAARGVAARARGGARPLQGAVRRGRGRDTRRGAVNS